MRLQLCSDLHFEFHKDGGRSFVDSLDPEDVDVLVVAGDIAVGAAIPEALALLCGRYHRSKVVYVHGNHEFYSTDREAVVRQTRRALEENQNLVWLDCTCAEISGHRFLGAPLWFRRPADARLALFMADFTEIRGFESWVYEENARALEFFDRELREGDIVVTHHLPSQWSISPRFAAHPLNPFFLCDVERLIRERAPSLWMHGHTHTSVRCDIGPTKVLCNPFGYAGHELNPEFSGRLIVDM